MATLQEISKGKNFVVYSDGQQKLIKLLNVRASYPHFGKKRVETDEETGRTREAWNGVAMLNKTTHAAAHAAFTEIMTGLMAAQRNDKGGLGVRIPPEYLCLKDGDSKDDENMHDHWLVSFSDTNRRPAIRDQRGSLILDEVEIDNKFYGGCYINVLLRPWFFSGKAKNSSKTFPKRICCGFTGAQFAKDGDPFGSGRIDDTDAWAAVEGSEDGDDGL